jgi:hypothetical protein
LPAPDWNTGLRRQIALARGAAVAIALDYSDAGFTAILDDFYDPPGMREYRTLLARPGTLGVLLHPTEAEAHRRNAARGAGMPDPADERAIAHAHAVIGPALDRLRGEGWLIVDTSGLDVPATVEAILAGLRQTPP